MGITYVLPRLKWTGGFMRDLTDLITEDEFYRRREDRTRRLAPNLQYQNAHVAVTLPPENAVGVGGQIMLCTTANLLARWARTITIVAPDEPLLTNLFRHGCRTLHDRIRYEVRQANPFCNLQFLSSANDALHLHLGALYRRADSHYAVDVDGWDVLGWSPRGKAVPKCDTRQPTFVPAAQLAAALGAAQLFKLAVRQPDDFHLGDFRWNMWDHRVGDVDAPSPISPAVPTGRQILGNILQVGVGAVGSNALYFLPMTDSDFRVDVVDDDLVDLENLDRSMLFGIHDALPARKPKVAAAYENLKQLGVDMVTPFPQRWDQYVRERLSERSSDVWLALANEDDIWPSMAENLPPIVIHGTTSDNWGVSLGRHIPFMEYCLRCRFPPEDDFQTVCGHGPVDVHSEDGKAAVRIDASLPFLSAAAAALVVGELMKLALPEYSKLPNYVEADLNGTLQPVLRLRRGASDACPVCQRSSTKLWLEHRGESMHSHLSRPMSSAA